MSAYLWNVLCAGTILVFSVFFWRLSLQRFPLGITGFELESSDIPENVKLAVGTINLSGISGVEMETENEHVTINTIDFEDEDASAMKVEFHLDDEI